MNKQVSLIFLAELVKLAIVEAILATTGNKEIQESQVKMATNAWRKQKTMHMVLASDLWLFLDK